MRTAMLVVAKAPEPGRAKTRLCPPATLAQAAEIAAVSLLDTLLAVRAVPESVSVVAWVGTLAHAARGAEVAAALSDMTVLAQRGADFGARLAAAHHDSAATVPGCPVLQIGMDTPQVTSDLLAGSSAPLHRLGGPDAVLGPASDGGWWALGLRDPRHAEVLRGIPTSQPDTGQRTLAALRDSGLRVELLPEMSDVDTVDDALRVARLVPGSRFADAVTTTFA